MRFVDRLFAHIEPPGADATLPMPPAMAGLDAAARLCKGVCQCEAPNSTGE